MGWAWRGVGAMVTEMAADAYASVAAVVAPAGEGCFLHAFGNDLAYSQPNMITPGRNYATYV